MSKNEIALQIEEHFEQLVAKVGKAISSYDARLLAEIEATKNAMLATHGIEPTPATDAEQGAAITEAAVKPPLSSTEAK